MDFVRVLTTFYVCFNNWVDVFSAEIWKCLNLATQISNKTKMVDVFLECSKPIILYIFHSVSQIAMKLNSAPCSWVVRHCTVECPWSTWSPVSPASPSSQLRTASKSLSGSTINHQPWPLVWFLIYQIILCVWSEMLEPHFKLVLIFYRAVDSALQKSSGKSSAHSIQQRDHRPVEESAFMHDTHQQVYTFVPSSLRQAVPGLWLRLHQTSGAAGGRTTCFTGSGSKYLKRKTMVQVLQVEYPK